MAKQLTQQELDNIRKRAIETCKSSGVKPMIPSPYGEIVNPAFATCLQKEYNNGLKASSEGKLSQWYQKTDNFIKSQGGFSSLFDKTMGLVGQFQTGYDKGLAGQSQVFGVGYNPEINAQANETPDKDKSNIGLWIGLVAVLILLIIFSIIYFRGKKNG